MNTVYEKSFQWDGMCSRHIVDVKSAGSTCKWKFIRRRNTHICCKHTCFLFELNMDVVFLSASKTAQTRVGITWIRHLSVGTIKSQDYNNGYGQWPWAVFKFLLAVFRLHLLFLLLHTIKPSDHPLPWSAFLFQSLICIVWQLLSHSHPSFSSLFEYTAG